MTVEQNYNGSIKDLIWCIQECINIWYCDSSGELYETRWGTKTLQALEDAGLAYDEETGQVHIK